MSATGAAVLKFKGLKFVLPALKVTKVGPVFSMALSALAYGWIFGWPFGCNGWACRRNVRRRADRRAR